MTTFTEDEGGVLVPNPDVSADLGRRASFLQAAHHGHDLLGKPAHAGQDVTVWYQAARVEPTDELIHLALRVNLLNLAYAVRGRAIERHRLDLIPSDGLDPLPDLP